jgi:hypothetical protein
MRTLRIATPARLATKLMGSTSSRALAVIALRASKRAQSEATRFAT